LIGVVCTEDFYEKIGGKIILYPDQLLELSGRIRCFSPVPAYSATEESWCTGEKHLQRRMIKRQWKNRRETDPV